MAVLVAGEVACRRLVHRGLRPELRLLARLPRPLHHLRPPAASAALPVAAPGSSAAWSALAALVPRPAAAAAVAVRPPALRSSERTRHRSRDRCRERIRVTWCVSWSSPIAGADALASLRYLIFSSSSFITS